MFKNVFFSCSPIAVIVFSALAISALSGCGSHELAAPTPASPPSPEKDHGHSH